MAAEVRYGFAGGVSKGGSVPAGGGGRKGRSRKVYDHEMTPAEQFALQTVQRASGALRVLNDAIKSGKPVNAKLISLCTEIVNAAGEILFGSH